jgi:G-patch domain
MMQEARNTDRHASGWGASRLRDNAVSFISAGNLTREEPPEKQTYGSSSSEEEEDEDGNLEEEQFKSHATQDAEAAQMTHDIQQATESMSITEPSQTTQQPVNEQDESPSSSEDEVVYRGRNAPAKPMKAASSTTRGKTISARLSPEATPFVPAPRPQQVANTDLANQRETGGPSFTTPAIAIAKTQPSSSTPQLSTSSDAAPSSSRLRGVNNRYRKRWGRKQVEEEEEDAILQDYIANMAKEDEDDDEVEGGNKPHRRNETFRFYDGTAENHVKVQTTGKSSSKGRRERPEQAIDWSSGDLEDFDDLSTTDDEVPNVGQVLRHRERPSGAQYLVTATGQSTSEAKWILHSKLTSTTALGEIQVFEEIRNMQIDIESEDSESLSTSAEEALEDLNEDIESEEDENTRIFQHTERMTDEEIARALAKQEELGMGGDEVMLFDGNGMEDSDDEIGNGGNFVSFSMGKHTSNRSRSKRNRRQKDSFPSAEAFADALDQDPYGAFDVMDFDRPSLRPKRKGRNPFPFDLELEDEDLAQQLVNAWTKDREKKATRKREKMDARAALLLEAGDRSDPAAIKAEIRKFLVEEIDTLRLAPMDAHLRASVHRLAKSLKLNSRSEGKDGVGAGRLPVLTKTPHTPFYTIETVWEVDALMNMRKFFPKHGGGSYNGPKATKVPGLRKKDRGGFAAASYANGEVVGAAAPELGVDNKGRAMLEKMGWTSGMGIGKEGNEGGLEHVKHVVKNNKAGLG